MGLKNKISSVLFKPEKELKKTSLIALWSIVIVIPILLYILAKVTVFTGALDNIFKFAVVIIGIPILFIIDLFIIVKLEHV